MAEFHKIRGKIVPVKKNTVTVENCNRLIMEGVERIVFCDSERMILEGKFVLTVTGKGLFLRELGNFNMEVHGEIRTVTFGREEA